MNREIKFRGINPATNTRLNPITIQDLVSRGLSKSSAEMIIYQRFTGFQDCNGKDIYEGDDLGDWNVVDGKKVLSRQRVFWNQPTGSWHLDQSHEQDQSFSTELWLELQDFKYEVLQPKL